MKTTTKNTGAETKTNYQLEVLDPHKEAKQFFGTLSGCRSKLLTTENLPSYMRTILTRSKKIDNLFVELKKLTRTSKAGKYSDFYLRQTMYSNRDYLLSIVK